MPAAFPIDEVRDQFHGLRRQQGGQPVVFLDGPGGSQVPARVAAAVSDYLLHSNANSGGAFASSRDTDELLAGARQACAELLNAPRSEEIVFGPNMTSLTFGLAAALGATWRPGDEVMVTQLEHDANFTPWVVAAQAAGAVVREVPVVAPDCTLDLDALAALVGPRTRLVAVGAASNLVGTLAPVREIVELARGVGAEVFVDAVHYAPHAAVDVLAWGCDYAVCSLYKLFGPHVGALWGRYERLAELPVRRVRPASDAVPSRWMPGTQNHEGIVGAAAAVEYLVDLGRRVSPAAPSSRRAAIEAAFAAIGAHERALCRRLLDRLAALPKVRVVGLSDRARDIRRAPTVALTHARHTPAELARALAARGVFVWAGNCYALPLTTALGLEPHGVLRAGLLHYNTAEEVDRFADELGRL
jgi:cysteine desulfurase family protein (TIGR01976 family)